MRKYIKCSKRTYIRVGTGFRLVDGKRVKFNDFEGFDFFLAKTIKGKLSLWCAYEAVTGCRLTKFYTDIAKAKVNAQSFLNSKSKGELSKRIDKTVSDLYLSPAFKFANNTKVRYVATKRNKAESLDDALRNKIRVYKK